MIGTIRKHSKWLWIIIAALTIVSFVIFMGAGPARSGGGSAAGGYGSLYGQPVAPLEFQRAQNEFYIFYWLHYNQWPDKNAGVSRDEIERETYFRLLLSRKAAQMGIHISDDALATAASGFLRSLGRNGQPVRMADFVERVLLPEHLDATDLQNFLRDELVIQQLIQTFGLSGALVTPQEAGFLYDREHQEISAQVVFFTASNYLAQVTVTPAAVAQFYTNNLAAYREPDRVAVNYVFYDVSNYLAAAKAEWEKTNFTEAVESVYQQYGQSGFPEAKTPDEAKAKIRELLIRNRALVDARQLANEFATELFAISPVKPENLATLAKQKGLAVHATAPFSANFGPTEFSATQEFIKDAFQLNADVPFAGPIVTENGIYIIALASQLPSAIPPLAQIRARVTRDFQADEAVALARRAGTNYYQTLTTQMAAGKTFAQAAVAAGQTPLVLPPFSLSTSEMPELEDRASLGQIKQAAFTTTVGHVSGFQPTSEGGFILFVQQMLPVDETKKNSELPQFTAQVRRARQNEAFNLWVQAEANRELRDTPVFKKETAGALPQP
jgi:peptidyl-prolyl cis-trans isomerase D